MAGTPCFTLLHVRLRNCNRGRWRGYGGLRAHATASRMQLRRCGGSPGRRTDKERRTMVGTGRAAANPVVALTATGRTRHRCRGKSLAMAPMSSGRSSAAVRRAARAVRSRSVADRPGGGRPIVALASRAAAWPGRVPLAGGAGRIQRTGRTPLMMRAGDSRYPSRATGSDLSRSHFVSGRTPSNIPGRKTAPYGWIDGYLRRICNRQQVRFDHRCIVRAK